MYIDNPQTGAYCYSQNIVCTCICRTHIPKRVTPPPPGYPLVWLAGISDRGVTRDTAGTTEGCYTQQLLQSSNQISLEVESGSQRQ